MNTEFDLLTATRQEIFSRVERHLLTQRQKSRDTLGNCVYRTQDDEGNLLMCAAGCLIPENKYHAGIEHKGWSLAAHRLGLNSPHDGMIKELQRLHDHVLPDLWEEELLLFAERHHLTTNPELYHE
jgi:hypothetical protein